MKQQTTSTDYSVREHLAVFGTDIRTPSQRMRWASFGNLILTVQLGPNKSLRRPIFQIPATWMIGVVGGGHALSFSWFACGPDSSQVIFVSQTHNSESHFFCSVLIFPNCFFVFRLNFIHWHTKKNYYKNFKKKIIT